MSAGGGSHVTLVVPGLAGPGPVSADTAREWCGGLALPAVETCLSFGDPISPLAPWTDLASLLFGCFGVTREGPDWPVAAVTRQLDGGDDGAWWLRADPVYLRVDRGELVLAEDAPADLSDEEARALAEELNRALDDPARRIEAPCAARWYLRQDSPPDLTTEPLWDVRGGPVGERLPRGGDAHAWRRWLNDVQMVLHDSAVNRAREGRGVPPVNSLWPWGGGRAPRPSTGRWASVWGDEPLVAGLGRLAGARPDPAVTDGRTWLDRTASGGDHLVVLSAAYGPVVSGDVQGWLAYLPAFEAQWMAEMVDAVRAGRLETLRLVTGRGGDLRVTRRGLRRWWRRRRSFSRLVGAAP